jgi:hypothetical protein
MQWWRGEILEVSAYFFCLDTKKVTKKNQGCAQMAKNGRVSPAQKKLAGGVFVMDWRAGSDSFFVPSRLRRSHGASLPFS